MTETDLRRLREDVAVATFPEGGLLLHLPSGDFFELDRTGAAIWQAIADTESSAEAAELIRTALAIALPEAHQLLEDTTEQGWGPRKAPPPEKYRFEDSGDRLSLRQNDVPLLTLDRGSLTLSVALDATRGMLDVAALVRIFVPKILGTWYPLALHASAIKFQGSAVLFSGASGAGKTTTAQTLAEARSDVTLLSEDVVLFSSVGEKNSIVVGAEAAVHPFLIHAAETLASGKGADVDVGSLLRSLRECRETVDLRKIVFLDGTRRQGTSWTVPRITRARALRLFFINSFLGSSTPTVLCSHLKACRAIAANSLAAEAATIPAGLADLRTRSASQIEMIAS